MSIDPADHRELVESFGIKLEFLKRLSPADIYPLLKALRLSDSQGFMRALAEGKADAQARIDKGLEWITANTLYDWLGNEWLDEEANLKELIEILAGETE